MCKNKKEIIKKVEYYCKKKKANYKELFNKFKKLVEETLSRIKPLPNGKIRLDDFLTRSHKEPPKDYKDFTYDVREKETFTAYKNVEEMSIYNTKSLFKKASRFLMMKNFIVSIVLF